MPVVIDFETREIVNGSGVAPRPVGVSIQRMGKEPTYYGFGHYAEPGTNTCQEYFAKAALARVWDTGEDMIFHNCKFDIDVAETHWGLPWPKKSKVHDTQFLLYLHNPLARELSLK